MISIRCIMGDGHIKGTQWCHLGRKRKIKNLYSISCSYFQCDMGKCRSIFMCSKERTQKGWVEHSWLSMTACAKTLGTSSADTLGGPPSRLVTWYVRDEKHQQKLRWVNGIWGFSEGTDQTIGEQVPSQTCYWHLWSKEQLGCGETWLQRPVGPGTGQEPKQLFPLFSPQQRCALEWRGMCTNIWPKV